VRITSFVVRQKRRSLARAALLSFYEAMARNAQPDEVGPLVVPRVAVDVVNLEPGDLLATAPAALVLLAPHSIP
jgi:hypothetical protein